MWTKSEQRILEKLSSPHKIQKFIDGLTYNPEDDAFSPRQVLVTKKAHCLEGAMLAAAALEFHGVKPFLIDLVAHRDDHHVITVFKTSSGWGSLSKSNTTLLRGRTPLYKTYRELVMSYFDFYFNQKGQLSLESFSKPISFERFKKFNWRWTSENLIELGYSLESYPHISILPRATLVKLKPVSEDVNRACFLFSDRSALF